jgi:tetratricopeptide (TPR) repeat protein
VKIWDIASGEEIRTITGHQNGIPSLAFSPNGAVLATASRDRTVRLWKTTNWTETRKVDVPDRLMAIAYSPRGDQIVAAGDAGTIYVWDSLTSALRYSLTGHSFTVRGLAFSLDGRTLASASLDRTVKIWDLQTGRETRTLRGHTDWVYCVAFSPDGRTLASGSEDQTVRMWDTLSPQLRDNMAHAAALPGLDFDDPKFRLDRAELRVRFGQYGKAAADYAHAIESQLDDTHLWYSLGIAYLAAADWPHYRATCAAMVDRFGDTTDGEVARRILYTCLPGAGAVPDPARLLDLAKVGAEWRCDRRVVGAALYRTGKYAESVASFEEAAQDVSPRAWDWLFLAMAHHRLGHTTTAHECLAKGVEWQRQNSVPWTERMETECLRKEAEELLNGDAETHVEEAP